MRFLILSDIHANWHALQSVVEDAKNQYDEIVCCGDIVGYNAQPVRVVEWVQQNCPVIVRGNHDKVVAGLESIENFTELAHAAALWTMEKLNTSQIEYLQSLRQGPLLHDKFQLWHGSLADEDEYVTTRQEAAGRFRLMETSLAFFGHTHVQGGFFSKAGRYGSFGKVPSEYSETVVELEPDLQYMINPGSVGQPRDGDPRAAYALYNSEERVVRLRRVQYPVMQTVEEIHQAGLPQKLAVRLLLGR